MTSPLKCFTLNPYIATLLFVTMQLAQKESGNSRCLSQYKTERPGLENI